MTYLLAWWDGMRWVDVHCGYKSYDLNDAHQECYASRERMSYYSYMVVESTTDLTTLPLPTNAKPRTT